MIYRFYSKPDDKVRVSVVGKYDNGTLKIAAARCSSKDSFIRKKGKMIAEGRLQKGKLFSEIELSSCEVKDFVSHAKLVIEKVKFNPNFLHEPEQVDKY